VISVSRILVASSVAPLAAVAPVVFLAIVMWSHFEAVALARPDLSALEFAALFAVPIYIGLVLGLFLLTTLLHVLDRLTRQAMFIASAATSFVTAASFGCDWQSSCALSEALPYIGVQFVVAFAALAGVSALWWQVAERGNRKPPRQRGAREA